MGARVGRQSHSLPGYPWRLPRQQVSVSPQPAALSTHTRDSGLAKHRTACRRRQASTPQSAANCATSTSCLAVCDTTLPMLFSAREAHTCDAHDVAHALAGQGLLQRLAAFLQGQPQAGCLRHCLEVLDRTASCDNHATTHTHTCNQRQEQGQHGYTALNTRHACMYANTCHRTTLDRLLPMPCCHACRQAGRSGMQGGSLVAVTASACCSQQPWIGKHTSTHTVNLNLLSPSCCCCCHQRTWSSMAEDTEGLVPVDAALPDGLILLLQPLLRGTRLLGSSNAALQAGARD